MIQGKKVLAIIPARGGSKGIPNKNIKILGNEPLISYTIKSAIQSEYIDNVIVSTDTEKIATIARQYGAEVPGLRPSYLADDTAKTIDAICYTVDCLKQRNNIYDIIVLLQCTSPFRKSVHIDEALEIFIEKGEEGGLVSVTPVEEHPILMRTIENGYTKPILAKNSTIRRQDMPAYYRVNGAIYINSISEIVPTLSFNDNKIAYIMKVKDSLDIDTMADWSSAEQALKEQG